MGDLGVQLMPWDHATSGLCNLAAERWLKAQDRCVKKVHACDEFAVFYESAEGEARYQRWRPDPKDLNKLVLDGPHRSGWPVLS